MFIEKSSKKRDHEEISEDESSTPKSDLHTNTQVPKKTARIVSYQSPLSKPTSIPSLSPPPSSSPSPVTPSSKPIYATVVHPESNSQNPKITALAMEVATTFESMILTALEPRLKSFENYISNLESRMTFIESKVSSIERGHQFAFQNNDVRSAVERIHTFQPRQVLVSIHHLPSPQARERFIFIFSISN